MTLSGYVPVEVTPWENASGGKAIECSDTKGCSASFRVSSEPGKYEIDVEYFDQNNGKSRFRVLLNNNKVDEWAAEDYLPAKRIGGDSSTRRRIYELPLQPGDEIRLEGVPDGQEKAGLDYVEIFPN